MSSAWNDTAKDETIFSSGSVRITTSNEIHEHCFVEEAYQQNITSILKEIEHRKQNQPKKSRNQIAITHPDQQKPHSTVHHHVQRNHTSSPVPLKNLLDLITRYASMQCTRRYSFGRPDARNSCRSHDRCWVICTSSLITAVRGRTFRSHSQL